MIHERIKLTKREGAVYDPELVTYIRDPLMTVAPNKKRPMVVICPGGGYEHVSEREAEPIALALLERGFNACYLKYNVAPTTFPTQLLEVAEAVALVRQNEEKWHVDTNRVIVGGFSAGGHLAGSLGVFWSESFLEELMGMKKECYQPNGLMLCYPVISSGEKAHRGSFDNLVRGKQELLEKVSLEQQVSAATPKSFLWHTADDTVVPVENSMYFASALQKVGVPYELHIFPTGVHGLSLATEDTMFGDGNGIQEECQIWIDLFETWLNHF